jgi:phenylpyruvate tautomerase PptA (4-oxalocrotonate tautomerase family)
MPQLNLNFIDIPIPETCLWEQFDDEQKRIVIETLTRLLVKLAQANNQQEQIQKEQNND